MISGFSRVNRVKKRSKKDGKVVLYYYHRVTGTRLYGDPGSAEFAAGYAAAELALRNRHHNGNLSSLARSYISSPEFSQQLSISTQREYRRMLAKFEVDYGNMPLDLIGNDNFVGHFKKWRRSVMEQSGAREADHRTSAVSAMLSWAVEQDIITKNNLRGIKRLYKSDRSEIIWRPEHIKPFMAVAPTVLQQALILALHTAQRQADILRLEWSAYDGKHIRLRPSKSARSGQRAPLVTIRCTPALRSMLDGMERTGPTILTTKTGLALKKRYFARMWQDAARQAGVSSVMLPGHDRAVRLHFHDLRGTAITLMSQAGATPQAIAAITGHRLKSVTQILERYLARSNGLGDRAIELWETSAETAFANSLQTRNPAREGKP